MRCPVCGSEIEVGQNFCTNCGAKIIREETPVEPQVVEEATFVETEKKAEEKFEEKYVEPETVKPESESIKNDSCKAEPVIPDEYKPLSMWAYIGYQLLFGLPVIGWIFVLVFAFGADKNKNLTNFAKSNFVWLILQVVICAFAIGSLLAYFALR